jgi:hypothetical protein
MPIQFACSCGRKLQAQDEHAGRRVQCPSCGAEMTVPAGETAVQTAEDVPPRQDPVKAERPGPLDDDDAERVSRRRSRDRDEDDEDDRPRRRRREYDEDDEDYSHREPTRTSGKATAALVLGALSFLGLCCLGSIPAIILGSMSLKEIKRSRGRLGGKGMATAGLILGGINLALLVPLLLIALLGSAVQKVRESAARIQSANNLKQMVLAMHNYNAQFGRLPQANPDPKLPPTTQLSWRVQLLPYLEQDNLWKQFHQDEPWDSPHNKALLTRMPSVFAHPNHPEDNAKGLTYYRVFVGDHTAFPPGKVTRIPQNFPDGTSNTILIVEAADPVPWTKPDELVYDPNKPLPRLGGHFVSGANAAMADGSVVILRVGKGLSEPTLRSAIDPADGMPLGADWP